MYCGNISDVYAADPKDLFRKEWSKYVYLRNEINVMNLPDREKIERAESLDAKFIRELSPFVIDELMEVSREPLAKEFEGVRELILLIQSKGIKIDEVRFVDAVSLSRRFTDKATKDRIISMLSTGNEKECKDFINEGFKNSVFSNSYLKSKVRETIEQGCAQSKSFRDALVAAFGQVISGSSKIFDQMSLEPTPKSSDYMIFEDGTWPRSRGNIITLIQNLDDICKNSFFHSRHSQKRIKTGSYAVKHDDISVLYHEIGHFLSADFLKSAEIFGINETIKLIALLSNNLTFNEKALNDFFELLKAAPEGINIQEKCIVDCLLGPVFAKARGLDLIKALGS